MNQLYYGDCFTIIQELPASSVDLIYLDPPFTSTPIASTTPSTRTKQAARCPTRLKPSAICGNLTLRGRKPSA